MHSDLCTCMHQKKLSLKHFHLILQSKLRICKKRALDWMLEPLHLFVWFWLPWIFHFVNSHCYKFLICMLYVLTYVFLSRYFAIGVNKIHNDQGSIPLGKTMLKAPSIEFVTPKQIKQSYLDFLLGFGFGCLNTGYFMIWVPIFLSWFQCDCQFS